MNFKLWLIVVFLLAAASASEVESFIKLHESESGTKVSKSMKQHLAQYKSYEDEAISFLDANETRKQAESYAKKLYRDFSQRKTGPNKEVVANFSISRLSLYITPNSKSFYENYMLPMAEYLAERFYCNGYLYKGMWEERQNIETAKQTYADGIRHCDVGWKRRSLTNRRMMLSQE